MKIAVDAMGGDHAPGVVIDGAILAAKEHGVEIVLVGDQAVISTELEKKNVNNLTISIKHAPQIVSMSDTPSIVLRKKKDSSVRVAFDMVKNNEADGVISAGNSGATMVAGISVFKRLDGVERPAIAALLPNVNGYCLLLDAGANVDCRVRALAQFGFMGYAYSKYALGVKSPRVALLSNGSEESKGTDLTRGTNEILKKSNINYIGYAEGRDVYNGSCDVMVCDGFVGNVVLKVSEGLAEACVGMVKEEVKKTGVAMLGALLMKKALKKFKRRIDYAETGGAPLLGVDGVGVIAHGGSSAKAIMNAILVAERNAKNCVKEHIADEINKNAYLFENVNSKVSVTKRK